MVINATKKTADRFGIKTVDIREEVDVIFRWCIKIFFCKKVNVSLQ